MKSIRVLSAIALITTSSVGCTDALDPHSIDVGLSQLNSLGSSDFQYTAQFWVKEQVHRRPGMPDLVIKSANVWLTTDDSSHSCYGGAVTLNGTVVPAKTLPAGTLYELSDAAPPWSPNVVFDGRWNTFEVEGVGNCMRNIKDSVRSPNSAVAIVYPTPTDTVARLNGLTVTWNSGTGRSLVRVLGERGVGRIYRDAGADTAFSFSATDLSVIPDGRLVITVQRYRASLDSTGGVARGLAAISEQIIYTRIE